MKVFLGFLQLCIVFNAIRTVHSSECGVWWTTHGPRFFLFCTCTQGCSFNSAMKECEEKQAELAKCDSRELENFFVRSLNNPEIMLLGGNDRVDEGAWLWPDGSLLNESYTNWKSGQPSGKTGENCLEWFSGNEKWFDEPCDDQYLPGEAGFVCEKKHM